MHAHDFRPHDSSRATHRRAADRVVAQARAANGPVRVPFAGGTVAAFRAGAKVRFEVVAPDGSFADFHSGGASRAVASMMADSFF